MFRPPTYVLCSALLVLCSVRVDGARIRGTHKKETVETTSLLQNSLSLSKAENKVVEQHETGTPHQIGGAQNDDDRISGKINVKTSSSGIETYDTEAKINLVEDAKEMTEAPQDDIFVEIEEDAASTMDVTAIINKNYSLRLALIKQQQEQLVLLESITLPPPPKHVEAKPMSLHLKKNAQLH